MPVLAFDMTTANHAERRFEFRGENNSNYYDGELECLSERDVDMKIEKSTPGQYAIFKLTSRSGLTFRRTWAHIRKDKTDVTVFWFVRRGEMTLSHPGSHHVVHPQECTITRSSRAFYMELNPDESGQIEVLHIVVPSHKLHAVLSNNAEIGKPIPASQGDIAVTERMLTLLFEGDNDIDPEIAEQLAETLLTGLSKTVARFLGNPVPRPSIADKRIADITRYISQNFSNPDLNQKMVADRCGISLRYLCYILKKHDLSFSALLWERRITTSRDWLEDAKMQHYSISEIAYMAGFKSSAHFSRMFKIRYGIAPREFRNTQMGEHGQDRGSSDSADTSAIDTHMALVEPVGGAH